MIIRYAGLEKLARPEKVDVESLAERYAQRLERFFPQPDAELQVHLKRYDQAGARIKYSVHVRVGIGKSGQAEAVDWDLRKATRSALEKLEKEIKHKFKRE
ncbi:MAG: HPF/RaiA family ribosome-associated protein [Nanoarchaeota archaeon]